MNTIGRNDELFNYMALNKMYLISSVLNRIDIFDYNGALVIEMHFKLASKGEVIKLRLTGIIEYSFYYKNNNYFYNVTYCKFFSKDGIIYISLDPIDETEEINENDQDFVVCKSVEGFS